MPSYAANRMQPRSLVLSKEICERATDAMACPWPSAAKRTTKAGTQRGRCLPSATLRRHTRSRQRPACRWPRRARGRARGQRMSLGREFLFVFATSGERGLSCACLGQANDAKHEHGTEASDKQSCCDKADNAARAAAVADGMMRASTPKCHRHRSAPAALSCRATAADSLAVALSALAAPTESELLPPSRLAPFACHASVVSVGAAGSSLREPREACGAHARCIIDSVS